MSTADEKQWWHIFGGFIEELGGYGVMAYGPGNDPATVPDEDKAKGLYGLGYITSIDHYPTDAERDVWAAELESAAELNDQQPPVGLETDQTGLPGETD